MDYDRCINEPFLEVLEGLDNKVKCVMSSSFIIFSDVKSLFTNLMISFLLQKAKKYEAIKWILVFAIGVSTGLVCFGVVYASKIILIKV